MSEFSWKVLLAAKKKGQSPHFHFCQRMSGINQLNKQQQQKAPKDKVRICRLFGEWWILYHVLVMRSAMELTACYRHTTYLTSEMPDSEGSPRATFQNQKGVTQHSCSLPVHDPCTKRHTAPAQFFGTVPYMTQIPRRNIRTHYTHTRCCKCKPQRTKAAISFSVFWKIIREYGLTALQTAQWWGNHLRASCTLTQRKWTYPWS